MRFGSQRNLVKRALRRTWSIMGSVATCGCVVLILPFFTAGLVVMKCHRCIKHQGRQGRRVYLKSESTHPLPLPLRRRFNLSDPHIHRAEQVDSRLMALPFELRERIWTYALGQRYTLDIRRAKGADRMHCLLVPGYEFLKRLDFGEGIHLRWSEILEDINDKVSTSNFKPAFALIRTCRQIYDECMPILYSNNTFRFTNLDNVCFFNQGIRRQWAARLRNISLVTRIEFSQETMLSWESLWFQMATWMIGLTQLSVEVGLQGFSGISERKLLLSAVQVSGLKNVKMNLWHIDNAGTTQIKLGQLGTKVETAMKRPRGSQMSSLETLTLERMVILMDTDDDL